MRSPLSLSALRLVPYTDVDGDPRQGEDEAAHFPFVPFAPGHMATLGHLQVTSVQVVRLYLGLRSASSERRQNIWRYWDYWLFANLADARNYMEAEYRRGYLVRVLELPALLFVAQEEPATHANLPATAFVIAELGTDQPFDNHNERFDFSPGVSPWLLWVRKQPLPFSFAQLFGRLPAIGGLASYRAWVVDLDGLAFQHEAPEVGRPHLMHSRGLVRGCSEAGSALQRAWKSESTAISVKKLVSAMPDSAI